MNQLIVSTTQKRAIRHIWKSVIVTLGDKHISTITIDSQSADKTITVENDCYLLKDKKQIIILSKSRNDEAIICESLKNVTKLTFERIDKGIWQLDFVIYKNDLNTTYRCNMKLN